MNDRQNVLIDQLHHERHDGYQELSADVDGERLWFRFPPELPLRISAELFLPAALMEAMVRKVSVQLATPFTLSPRLLDKLDTLQRIFTTWNPHDFHQIEIHAAASVMASANDWVVCCYSGGVDSAYTYLTHREQITHLLLVQGFDGDSDEDSWQKNVLARRAFAQSEGKALITVASNLYRFLSTRKLSWSVAHGSILAALGVSLPAKELLIPSSFTYNELFPWGSHPLLDPCWSTESTEVIHHGLEASRTAKTIAIAADQNILDHLQVCWRGVADNCGNCPKCVRTSLALHILGKTSRSLPPYQNSDQLRWLKPGNHASVAFTEDLILFCQAQGAEAIAAKLQSYRRRFLLKYHCAELLKVLFGRFARALSRRLWPKAWHQNRNKIRSEKF